MSSISTVSPDDFEKMPIVPDEQQPVQRRPSSESRTSNDEWYLKKRGSNSSSSNKSNDRKSVTALPPSVEVSLAILTSGLSVAAFHAVKSISERRAAKKVAAQSQQTDLSRARSMLVPSTMPEHNVPTLSSQSDTAPVAELDSFPVELDGSSVDSPPAYCTKVASTKHIEKE